MLQFSISLSHSIRGSQDLNELSLPLNGFYIFVWPSLLNPVGVCLEELAGMMSYFVPVLQLVHEKSRYP